MAGTKGAARAVAEMAAKATAREAAYRKLEKCVGKKFDEFIRKEEAEQLDQTAWCQPPTCISDGQPADVSVDAEQVGQWASECDVDTYFGDTLPQGILKRVNEGVQIACIKKQRKLAPQPKQLIELECNAPSALDINAAADRAAGNADASLQATLARIIGQAGGSGNWDVWVSYDPRNRPTNDKDHGKNGRVLSMRATPGVDVSPAIVDAVNKALGEAAKAMWMPSTYLNADIKGTTFLSTTLSIRAISPTLASAE